MALPNDPYGLGLVLVATGNGSGAYVDKTGVSRTPKTYGLNFQPGTEVPSGRSSRTVYVVHIELGVATGVTLRIRAKRTTPDVETSPGSAFGWAPLCSFSNMRAEVQNEHAYTVSDTDADTGFIEDVIWVENAAGVGLTVIEFYAAGGAWTAADICKVAAHL